MRIINFYTKIVRYVKKELNRNTLIFAVFFCIASLFWIINALNKTYRVQIPLKAHYSHIPKTKALVTSTPDIIQAEVTATGFSLLKMYMYSSKVIDFNIEKVLAQNSFTDSLVTISVLSYVKEHHLFSNSITISNVVPKTIQFAFAPISKKKVKVVPLYDIECVQQYQLKQTPRVLPDSMFIYGAHAVLKNIDSVFTTKIYARQVAESFSRKIGIQAIKNVSVSDTLVTVKAEIEKFTEQQFTVPIVAVNVPDSVIIDLMNHSVHITMFTGMSNIQSNHPSDFRVIADFTKQNIQTGEIPVEIVARPKWGRIVKISPEYVGFIIDSK